MSFQLLRAACRLALIPAAALALAGAPAAAQQFTGKLGTATISDDQHEWLKRFKDRIEARFPGKIKLDIYPASQLGSIARQIEGMQLGTVEGWLGPPGFLAGIEPRYQVFDSPGIFEGKDHCFKTVSDPAIRDSALKMAEPKGLTAVSIYCSSEAAYVAKKPIKTLEDFKGLKIRVLASKIERRAMEDLGATPTPMDLGEVVGALQQGAIDASKSGISIFYAFKYFNVAKYVTATHEAMIVDMVFLSKMWFDKLPADIQAAMREEGAKIDQEIHVFNNKFKDEIYENWVKSGGELLKLSPADQAELMRRTGNAGAEMVKDNPAQKSFHELLSKTAAKYKG